MYEDVIALRNFYHTPLGQHLAGQLRPYISKFWQAGSYSCNITIGYGVGWLSEENSNPAVPENLLSLMLARSGVIAWLTYAAVRSGLVDGHALPLPDVHVDRLLLAHALEFDPQPGYFLDECWRVLDGAGKLLVAVPNRRGFWARREHTPFGHGRPYSGRQLCQLLENHGFEPEKICQAVFLPPLRNRALMRFALGVERVGQRWWPALGGVLLVEAKKMLYAAAGNTSKVRRRRAGTAPVMATFINSPRKGCM